MYNVFNTMKIVLCLMKKIGGHMTTSTTKEMKVLTALQSGRTLSSAQLRSQFGAGNPQAVIQSLRFKGFPIYLNTVTDTKNRSRNVYRLGTPSRAIIAAGYKAMANS
jgi:hypothetical protein